MKIDNICKKEKTVYIYQSKDMIHFYASGRIKDVTFENYFVFPVEKLKSMKYPKIYIDEVKSEVLMSVINSMKLYQLFNLTGDDIEKMSTPDAIKIDETIRKSKINYKVVYKVSNKIFK